MTISVPAVLLAPFLTEISLAESRLPVRGAARQGEARRYDA